MQETELPLQLRDFWFIAAASRDLRGAPVARTILGEPVVLFRDGSGRAAALRDRCAHRNMRLSAGSVRDGAIECPYHGWTYRGDGTCARIPSLEGDPPPHVRVDSFPTREHDGFVWICLGDPASREPFRFPHAGEEGWTTFTMTTRFEAGAFSCLENFLDVPHTVYVHQGWFRNRAARPTRAVVRAERDGAAVAFDEEPEKESVVARLLFPRGGRLEHTDRFVLPAISRVDYRFGPDRHFIITSQCTPVSEHETDVYTVITFRFGRISPLVRLWFEPLSRKILRQDIEILREQTAQVKRFGGPKFTYVASDLLGPHILRHWKDAVAHREPLVSETAVTIVF
ncbi:MAG TPA: aromatic ring-hydroxylating dioxygenase subunit alpha [Thermoanaerobaculia bacterium]|nr:aromatic ring-hydroxylating dioxygenase subunit alpha [Thermoanaerobaculia bacterium]